MLLWYTFMEIMFSFVLVLCHMLQIFPSLDISQKIACLHHTTSKQTLCNVMHIKIFFCMILQHTKFWSDTICCGKRHFRCDMHFVMLKNFFRKCDVLHENKLCCNGICCGQRKFCLSQWRKVWESEMCHT